MTVVKFCESYGVEGFSELLDQGKTHAQIASALGVCPSAVTRMIAKFCDVHRVLKPDVVEFIEAHYALTSDALKREYSIIEEQKEKLKFIRGGHDDRTAERNTEQDP